MNGNQLESLPCELQGCQLLEELYASENGLHEIPSEIGTLHILKYVVNLSIACLSAIPCPVLTPPDSLPRTLEIQNNQIKKMPPELSDCISIEDIDCSGNKHLEMIPEKLRTDTKLIMWICGLHKNNREKITELSSANMELEDYARQSDEEKLKLKDEVARLKKIESVLVAERPERYLKATETLSKVCTIS